MPAPPKRILHLIDTGGPGGAETIFLELVSGLDPSVWQSLPVVPVEDWLAGAVRARGCSPLILRSRRSFDVGFLRGLRGLIRGHRVDLIQTHLLASSVYGTLAAAGSGIPVVNTFHGAPDFPQDDRRRWLKLRILRRKRNRMVFVSESLRKRVEGLTDLAQSRVTVIPNGVDLANFAEDPDPTLRVRFGIDLGTRLVGAVGNVRTSKAYDVLLNAFGRVRRAVPNAQLLIVGQTGGALYEDLLKLRSALGLTEAVHFLGFREDVPSILRMLDLFVLSSSDEGFSLSTVQAMASGLPVVVTRCGGPEEIVREGIDGHLVPPGQPRALADAMVPFLESAEMRRDFGRAGRDHVRKEFSLQSMVSNYERLYSECLKGRVDE